MKESFLNLFVLLKEALNYFFIFLKNSKTLAVKFSFNLFKLIAIIFSHVFKLLHHASDESLNVCVHLLHGLNIAVVLAI